jgi:hypothetical protein
MTTRLKGVTVAFNNDIREDDAESILKAIRMIKGVLDVKPIEFSSDDYIIESRIRNEYQNKILEIFRDKNN